MSSGSIPWSDRARAAACYIGLLPIAWAGTRWRRTPYLHHHYAQAAILLGSLVALNVLFVAALLALSWLLVFHRELYESVRLEGHTLGVLRKFYLAWAVFWAFALGMALLGARRPMPIVHRLAARPAVVRTCAAALCAQYGLLAVLAGAASLASRLVPVERTEAPVYMVYEDNGIFPRAMFALAFWPMARAAESVYGPGSAALLPISRDAIATALARGQFVFIGSHGTDRGLMLRDEWLLPRDLAAMPKGANLEFVYLTGCDSGVKREAWLDALAPAEVVTFDRLSASLEHAWWLWFTGPEKLRAIAGVPSHES